MGNIFKTERLRINEATLIDIPFIMRLEQHPDNRNFVVQGTVDEHTYEIQDPSHLLLIIKKKYELIGFVLCHKDVKNSSFELRRMIIQSKGKGYGKEVLLGIIDYSLNELGFHRFWLDVYEDNEKAIHLYESIGMELDGILKKSYKREGEFVSQHIYSIMNKKKEK